MRADLLLQWEVARKRSGRARTAVSAAWSPWWRFRLGRRIPSTAFRPRPAADGGILVIERRAEPLLPTTEHDAFRSFVSGLFDGSTARDLDAREWTALFAAYTDTSASGRLGVVRQPAPAARSQSELE
jgi:16S rRNA A1518/A1519 N6-dimethyltransferase RsmA/KsgA/DIM1 with predicted DNA glycosylase/AP lyase activity